MTITSRDVETGVKVVGTAAGYVHGSLAGASAAASIAAPCLAVPVVGWIAGGAVMAVGAIAGGFVGGVFGYYLPKAGIDGLRSDMK